MKLLPTSLGILLQAICWFSAGLAAQAADEIATYGFGVSSIVRDPQRDRIYCTVPSTNSVSVVDTQSLAVLATVFVGSQPKSLAVSPDASKLYVGLGGSSAPGIVELSLTTLNILRSFNTTGTVQGLVAGSGSIYTIESSSLRAYDSTTGVARSGLLSNTQGNVFVYGGLLKLSPDANTLYFYQTGLSPSSWYRINVASWPGTVAQTGQWGSNGQELALSADGQWITFASGSPYYVQKLQASNPTVSQGQWNTGAYPRVAAYSPDGTRIYTVNTSGSISVWSTTTYLKTKTLILTDPFEEPEKLECDRNGNVLFAGSSTSLIALYTGTTSGESMAVRIDPAVEIRWNSTFGYSYQVEWSTSPTGPTWNGIEDPVVGTGLMMSFFDNTRGGQAKFYRVRQVSP